jgi:hypothetical protein
MTLETNARIAWLPTLPTLVFDLMLAAWLIVNGVATPAQRQTA